MSQQPGMVVVGTVGSVVDSPAAVATLKPNVVILEFRLSDRSTKVASMIQSDSAAKLIFLTNDENENVVLAAIEIGVGAVLNMSSPATDVIQAVRTVAEGGTLITAPTISSLLRGPRKADKMRDKLTGREREVVSLMSEGVSNRQIAARMGISYTTVRSHVRNAASKLAAHSKLEVLVNAQRLDLVDHKTGNRISMA
ncbi:MAG TPA: response regulator transcription factor [Candidatus Limnocylindrales bacterium]|nr:response regulator transcription factor [Candidatus Limnocylindrales bacterium]